MRLLLIIAVLIVSILGYGYWHSSTHASFHISLKVNGGADFKTDSMPETTVQFLDSKGSVLADGVSDKLYNYVHLIHPVHGDCHEVEKKAPFSKDARTSWQECFEHQSTWIAKWIRNVNKVNVKFENCLIQNIQITVSRYNSDWYLWWVPHPHIGGTPYSYYSSTITIKENDCVVNNG